MSKVRTTLEALERHYTAANLAPGQPLPGVHQEGKSPLVPAEETGELLPDGRPKRKLPDIVDGSVDPIEMAKKYSFERSKRMQNKVGNQYTAHSLTPDTHAHSFWHSTPTPPPTLTTSLY